MARISRTEAIATLCAKQLGAMSLREKEAHLLDWWSLDEADEEYFLLPVELQHEIASADTPADPNSERYAPLLRIALQALYNGVTNEYLHKELSSNGFGDYEVVGTIEQMQVCPCCLYHTLKERCNFDICPLCDWEDNGIEELDVYSGPNHMTLRQAKERFAANAGKLDLRKWLKA